jgi:hypothetical protein
MKTKFIFPIFLIVILFSSCSSEKTIGIKQNIHHDDFEYFVVDYYKADDIAGQKSNGTFYVVTFKVQNDAKRVQHEWDNDIAYITDENGREYNNLIDRQKTLNTVKLFGLKDKYVTPAGASDVTILVFDIPKDVKEPYLKVRGEFLMGDLFDGNQFKKTKVKLF